jgi:hypothetical protein
VWFQEPLQSVPTLLVRCQRSAWPAAIPLLYASEQTSVLAGGRYKRQVLGELGVGQARDGGAD